jgi:hypothetical protein
MRLLVGSGFAVAERPRMVSSAAAGVGGTGDDAPEAVCAVAGEYLWGEGHYLVAVAAPPACPRRLLLASYGLGAGVDQAAMAG